MKQNNSLHRIGSLVLAALILFGVAIMSSTSVQAQRRGGFHGGGFRGGFHDRGFHGGFRPRIFIGPRFGYGYPYGYYGCPYGYSRYPYGPCYPW
jgi:hypothetical protein